MTNHFQPDADDPSTTRVGAGTVAVSIAAAALAGLVLLAQMAPSSESAPAARAEAAATPRSLMSALPSADSAAPAATARSRRAAAPPTTALDSGVDWSGVERAPEHPGASVGAYDR